MDVTTCLQKLQYVGVLAFATVDNAGKPQVRNISAIHYESLDSAPALYFLPLEVKIFAVNCWPMDMSKF